MRPEISSVAFAVWCKALHLGCHNRKAAAGFAGARRLDGRVERQQVGLLGDRLDQRYHLADFGRRIRQRAHDRAGIADCVTASCEIFEDSCMRVPISQTALSSWLVAWLTVKACSVATLLTCEALSARYGLPPTPIASNGRS